MSKKEFSRKLLMLVATCWLTAGAGLFIPWALNAKSTVLNIVGVTTIVVVVALIFRPLAKHFSSRQ